MQYQYKFEKILSIKEKEKDEAYAQYSSCLKQFEEAAEKLYKLLKKKEDLQAFQEEKLKSGLSVQHIRHQGLFMDNLEKLISHSQKAVMIARQKVNLYQEKLMESNLEVKKYEKIKEKEYTRFMGHINLLENRQMDEISIQQYMSRGL
ncbi:flagellar export protein FliJ [Peribacillus kribbensis]|uniref:flagellar export protein FliJ n=1 Tax=Peribacillus kribbensis TaxID=356658 RepID=UPI0004016CDA|nr:flagellar export protein FliJ [Peribacillus kribbensis]